MRHQNSDQIPVMLDEISKTEKENIKKNNSDETENEKEENKNEVILPQEFRVKYLGHRDATGLWGIKHTRIPVDQMVGEAKKSAKNKVLPLLGLHVSEKGVQITDTTQTNKEFSTYYPLEAISYGVQDLMFTRVFAMIVVKEEAKTNPLVHPFQCHAFVCDSRTNARKLTFALAEAFQIFSKLMKSKSIQPRKFAIDLRASEEMESDLQLEDSEA